MKIKINIFTVITLMLLLFCVSYLVTHLIMKGLYIDAAVALACPALLGLLIYCIRKGI